MVVVRERDDDDEADDEDELNDENDEIFSNLAEIETFQESTGDNITDDLVMLSDTDTMESMSSVVAPSFSNVSGNHVIVMTLTISVRNVRYYNSMGL